MNPEPEPEVPVKHGSGSSSSTTTGVPTAGAQRKERGAIAAQACDTCRSRKQKCDEQRPKCGTCQKFKLECNYRVPQPTKKDKTLVEILDRIKSLEGKIDSLSLQGSFQSAIFGSPAPVTTLSANPSISLTAEAISEPPPPVTSLAAAPPPPPPPLPPPPEPPSPAAVGGLYRYVSAVHQMLAWPAIQQLLATLRATLPSEMNSVAIDQDGPTILLGLYHDGSRLPYEPAGPMILAGSTSAPVMSLGASRPAGSIPLANSPLTWESMQRLSKAYFDTYNYVYPVLDRQSFVSGIMASVFNEGFDDGITSTLAFLVFALGEVAVAGVQGPPIDIYNGRPSGIKGGSIGQPPGLALFNEARKRMGFNLTECCLENVQVFALAGMYCGTCAHHMEFWRMSTTASLACQALITSKPSELTSPRADLVRRAFWYCSIIETCFNLELGLPLTGLDKLEDVVGLPDLSGPFSQDDYLANQASHFQEHFASQIVLRRLSMEFHTALTNADISHPTSATPVPVTFPPSSESTDHPSLAMTVRQLSLQLDQWRGMLPPYLRWEESQPASFPNPSQTSFHTTTAMFPPTALPVPSIQSPSGFMFTTDLDAPPTAYPYALDVQVALLRTSYYYTKYLIHRPFVYKALHHPEQMTRLDAEGAAECFKACLKWPVTMSPTCAHKRLVPCLFFWTQNLLGVLVLLHLSQTVPMLSRIRTTLCEERFELEASETVGLYMDWIRDLRSVDRAAAWAWEVVRAVYQVED